ncbi:MAG: hypothetical protein WA609_19015, partial [Terriglobales bacterium]
LYVAITTYICCHCNIKPSGARPTLRFIHEFPLPFFQIVIPSNARDLQLAVASEVWGLNRSAKGDRTTTGI